MQPEDDAEIRLEDPETNQEGSHDAQDDDNQLQGDDICLVQPVQDQEQNMNAAVRVRDPRISGRGIRGIRVSGGGLGLNRGRGRGVRHARNNPAPLAPQVPPNAVIWQWNRIYPRGPFRPRQIPFTGRQRIIANLPRNPTPQDFFKLYITEEIIDHLVTQTNLYAAQYIEREHDNLGPRSTVHQWIPTSRPEMLTLMGILILMGILHKPRMALHWSTDKLLATPIFSQVMRRDRLFLLLRFLHFADNRNYNQNDPGHDKLFKVREVMNMIKRRCSEVLYPGKYLSMDESLVLFKGRLSFKQYIKSKRSRFGIKLFQLCTANGILLDFLVYHGNMATGLSQMEGDSLLTGRISLTVMQQYLNKGHHLFIDNYYTSLPLAKFMLQNGTYLTGTIRENRKNFPAELKDVQLAKGEAAFYESDDIVIARYRSNKDRTSGPAKVVNILSTAHGAALGATARRDRDGNLVRKPTSIISYNHNMGGVDLMDQQLEGIDALRKAYKWYKKLFLRLVMQCSLSAHKLYKLQGGKDVFLYFLLDTITQLLSNSPRLERPLQGQQIDNIARLTGRNH